MVDVSSTSADAKHSAVEKTRLRHPATGFGSEFSHARQATMTGKTISTTGKPCLRYLAAHLPLMLVKYTRYQYSWFWHSKQSLELENYQLSEHAPTAVQTFHEKRVTHRQVG